MRTFWAQPLRRQLFIVAALLLVPVLVAAGWAGLTTFRERSGELRDYTKVVGLTTAAWVNRDLSTLDRLAAAVAATDFVQALDAPRSTVLFQHAVAARPAVVDIALIAGNGDLIAHGATQATTAEPGADWAMRVIRTGHRVVARLDAGHVAAQHVVVGYPVENPAGRVVAALGYVISLENLQQSLAALPLPKDSVILVLDQAGRVLLRTLDPEHHVGAVRPWPDALETGQGVSERRGLDGVNRMYTDVRVEEGPWLVSVGIPTATVWRETASLRLRNVAILLSGLTGGVIVLIVLSHRLRNSVQHLHAAAGRIADGDFGPMETRPMMSREFADLQSAFGAMLTRFNATRSVLDAQMSEERRIREELQLLQGQVIRQERLAAVGQLVSGVAHEINNPLQAILGFAELLQMQTNMPEEVKEDLNIIQKESARACAIIRNLALFARQQPGEAEPVQLTEVINSVAELRQRRLESENIEVRIEARSTQNVLALFTELQQVVLNFVVNAEQAVVSSGRLPGRITVRTYDVAGRVVLEVEDTGPGIPTENEAKLFQPFFTTKPVGQGTGLGLSVSYGIIDSLGGQIGHRAAPAGGAIFYFELPAVMGQ